MRIFKFLALVAAALPILSGTAKADYLVNLNNGESVRAKDYDINGWKIRLRLDDGSVSFPRTLVAFISWAEPLKTPPAPPEIPSYAAPAHVAAASPENNDPLPAEQVQDASTEEPYGPGNGKASADNMTVGEFLDMEAATGDNTYENSGQGDRLDYAGFMEENDTEK